MQRRQLIRNTLLSLAGIPFTERLLAATVSREQELSFFNAGRLREEAVVINAGVGGNNTADLLKRMEKDCLAHRPQLTVLMAGTNDMNSVKYIPLKEYTGNLSRLISRIRDSGSELLVMTILPAYVPYLLTRHPKSFYQPEGADGRRIQMNKAIRQVAAEHGVHLLDMERRFAAVGKIGTGKDSLIKNEANSNKTDGIHPTPNGYRFMALSVYDYITDHKLPTGKIVCFGDSITHGDGSTDGESYPAYLKKLLTYKEGEQ